MLFFLNRDTDVVSELIPGPGDERFKLSIIDGKRVKKRGNMFWAGNFGDMVRLDDEAHAWRVVERIAAEEAAANSDASAS